jgi:hypothetical protein
VKNARILPWDVKHVARWLRTLADRIDREPEQPIDLDDAESLSATEYAIVVMRLADLEQRVCGLEDSVWPMPVPGLLEWPPQSLESPQDSHLGRR